MRWTWAARLTNRADADGACGNAGCSGATVVTTLVCYLHFAHEAAGAAGTRHSPRPLFSKGASFKHNSGASRREIVNMCHESVIARSEATKAIRSFFAWLVDCFAEPVIGRRLAPTRWLAMTVLLFEN